MCIYALYDESKPVKSHSGGGGTKESLFVGEYFIIQLNYRWGIKCQVWNLNIHVYWCDMWTQWGNCTQSLHVMQY